ncbi:MAG TPA: glycosyltransferase family A protein [Pyrinomonadaceae bacterium]|nr:glycosyltransferase family A protein [Pyrinomonadaceae bacterium]
MPRASIIITTHNRPHLLPRAVESARLAGSDVEIIVVDDASTDETAKVCRALDGIRYVRVERNQGVAGARNVGILASASEYLCFLDDDDVRLAHTLDAQVEALASAPEAGMIYAQAELADQNGEPSGRFYPSRCWQGDIFWRLLSRNFIPCGSVVFRRSCLSRVGLLDAAVPGLDDWDLWIRISELYPVIALEQAVFRWRQSTPSSAQGTSMAAELVKQSARQFRERWMRLGRVRDATETVRRQARSEFSRNMASHLLWEAARAAKSGGMTQALRNLSTAMRLFPLEAMRAAINSKNIRALFVKYLSRHGTDQTGAYQMKEQAGRSE